MKKYKLKCFYYPYKAFENKDEVWRNRSGFPVCRDHAEEFIYDEFDENIDYILDLIEFKYNRNIKNFFTDINTNWTQCDECGLLFVGDEIIEYVDRFYCHGCFDEK